MAEGTATIPEPRSKVTGSEQGDMELVRTLRSLHRDAVNGTNACEPGYWKNLRLYTGDESSDFSFIGWKADTGLNIIQHIIDKKVGFETDASLIPVFEPSSSEDFWVSKLLEMLEVRRWAQPSHIQARSRLVKTRGLSGTGCIAAVWSELENDIITRLFDPRLISCTNEAASQEDITEYFRDIYLTPEEIQERWPGAPLFRQTEDTGKDGDDETFQQFENAGDTETPRLLRVTLSDTRGDASMLERVSGFDGKQMDGWPKMGWRRTAYYRDFVLGNKPLGRPKPPIIPIANYDVPDRIFGMSEVKNLWKLAREIRRLFDTLFTNAYLTGNPILLLSAAATVNPRKIKARPGLIIPVGAKVANVGQAIQYLSAPGVPPYIQWLLMTVLQLFERIAGVPDVQQGARPAGVSSGRAIQALQGAAATLPQQAVLNTHLGLIRLIRDELDLMTEHYSTERVVEIVGDEGEECLAKIREDAAKRELVRVIQKGKGRDGRFRAVLTMDFKRLLVNRARWDVQIKVGQPVISSRQDKFQQGAMMAKLGVLHRSMMLKFSGFSDSDIKQNEEAFLAEEKAKTEMRIQIEQAKAAATAAGQGGGNLPPGTENMDEGQLEEAAFSAAGGGGGQSF